LPNPDHRRTFSFLQLGQGGFAPATFTVENFSPDVVSQAASDGFWVSDGTLTIFYPVPGGSAQSASHLEPVLLAPNGKASASFFDGPLEVFAASAGYPIVLAAQKPEEDCSMVLAWSSKDRIACVTDAAGSSGHGEVRFFDLVAGNDVLEMSALGGFCEDDVSVITPGSCSSQMGRYGYTTALAEGAPRGFSRAGNWFAFTRSSGGDAYLYWANVGTHPLTLQHSLALGPLGVPKRLAFSPDEQKLAIQAGNRLFVQNLDAALPTLVPEDVRSVESCSEQFPTAPNGYCGDTERDAPFKWAPDSGALAYITTDSLNVVAVQDSRFPTTLKTAHLCEKPLCSGDFEFQPLISSHDP